MPNPWSGVNADYPKDWYSVIQPQILRQAHEICEIQGPDCIQVAREVDHIISIAEWKRSGRPGSPHVRSNLRAACIPCHREKTLADIDAGRTVANPRPEPESAGWVNQIDQALTKKDKRSASSDRADWFEYHGPMWELDSFGNYRLPEYTIGWQVLAWIMKNLQLKGKPIVPTGEQARFILWSYAVDEAGEWLYKELIKIASKGFGKDPLLAMIASNEMCGPSRFRGWKHNPDGTKTPIAGDQPGAWFQIAAVSEDQARNTFEYLANIFTPAARERYNIETPLGKNYYALGRDRKISRLSSTPDSKQGQFPTGVGLSELEEWIPSTSLPRLFNILKGNVQKVPGARMWMITNAYYPEQGSVIQQLFEEVQDWKNGRITRSPKRLIDAVMATSHADYKKWENRIFVLKTLYGESAAWVPINDIAANFDSTTFPISYLLVFFYNSISISANVWVDIRDWDACRDFSLPPDGLPPMGTRIVVGGDGSLNDDASGLVGMVWGGKYDGLIFPLGIWQPVKGTPVDRDAFDAKVDWMFSYYKVKGFWFDPSHKVDESDVAFWGPLVDKWHQKYGKRIVDKKMWATPDNAFKFDMGGGTQNAKFVEALQKLEALITDRAVRQNGDEVLRTHVMNARRTKKKGGNQTETIGKESKQSALKIDAAVCAVIAYLLYTTMSNIRKPPTDPTAQGAPF